VSNVNVENNGLLEKWRKHLIFRSNHRGTKETGIIMGSFEDQNVGAFDK
jgi:succinate dehydrogenase flavin-adding protein (antitoxin of CptAB toxin-antitoxin module)